MNYPICMAVFECQKKLIDDGFNLLLVQDYSLHIFLQVTVDVLKDKIQLILPRYNLFQSNHIRMVQPFQKGDLSYRS